VHFRWNISWVFRHMSQILVLFLSFTCFSGLIFGLPYLFKLGIDVPVDTEAGAMAGKADEGLGFKGSAGFWG
jgi:hypothetical protein